MRPFSLFSTPFLLGLPHVPASAWWTGATILLATAFWLALARTRWGRAAGWLALALAGQACALQLVEVGPKIRLQLFYGWSDLLKSFRGVFLLLLAIQAVIVFWGVARAWPKPWQIARTIGGARTWLFFLIFYAYASFTIAPELARAIFRGGLAYQISLHFSKAALGLAIFCVGALNLALAAAAVPPDALERARERWERSDRRSLPWLAALWVVVVASLLAWFVLERMPHVPDEVAYLFHANYLATGRLWISPPPDLEAITTRFTLLEGDRWYIVPPAGWAAVLALGVLAGVPWLVNPALGGLAVLLVHVLARKLYNRSLADGAVLLFATSPWFLFMCASLMMHPVVLVFALSCLLGVYEGRKGGGARWGVLAGLSVGAVLHVRPLDAFVLAAAAGIWWLSAGWKQLRWQPIFATAASGTLMTLIFLAYNQAMTGSPWLPPLNKYFDQMYFPGVNRLGFGSDVGNFGWSGLDALPGHGPIDVLMNTNQNLYLVNFELFGWACGSLLLLFPLVAWRLLRKDGLMWLLLGVVVAGLNLYWFSGGPDFGARYWYLVIVPLVVLTLRGGQELTPRLQETVAAATAGPRVWTFVVLASVLGVFNLVPWRSLDKYHHYRGMRPDIRQLARQNNFGRSLVLVQGPQWPDYAGAFAFNPARFDADVGATVYARPLGPDSVEKLRRFYAGRPVWIVAGPTITKNGYQVVAGPFAAGEPIPATETVPR